MQKNTILLILVILAGIALVIFVVRRNRKDKKSLMKKLNEDYDKPKEGDL